MVMDAWEDETMDPDAATHLPMLWSFIEQAHYVYLEIEDSPEKLEQRKKLEEYITKYLSIVPHNCKFGLAETEKVFQRTINELPDFSAYRAGLGWAALAAYASNLLAQPWRKEYRTIRLYSGYYKHEIEANLVGAELLLQQMGYQMEAGDCMSLDGPVCPDMVSAVSRDAIIAHVECQIMVAVWEAAWGGGASWADVVRARRRRGDSAAAAQFLAAERHAHGQEIYSNVAVPVPNEISHSRLPEQTRHPPYHIPLEVSPIEPPIVPMLHSPPYMTPQLLPPNMMYPLPPTHITEVPISMNQTVPVMTPYGAMPYYFTPYMIPAPVYTPIKQANTVPINGYNPMQQYRYPTVPTGQLIELDGPSFENGGKFSSEIEANYNMRKARSQMESSRQKSGFSDISSSSMARSDTQPALSKAREDGMGTYESWDYVFRNLSSKDHDERNRFSPSLDRDSRTLERLDKEERRSRYQPTTLDLEDGLQALSLDRSYDDDMYRTSKVNENLMRLKQESELKKARHLAKQHSEKKKLSAPVEQPICELITPKIAPDKVRLLTKSDVKDRKEVLKQQCAVNGAPRTCQLEIKKVKKIVKPITDLVIDRPKLKPIENGHNVDVNVPAKSIAGSSVTSQHSNSYDIKTHLIVSLDETDSRVSPPKQNGDRLSREPIRQNGLNTPTVLPAVKTVNKWECTTCTFINTSGKSACEMCGKSRDVGPECQPLTSGGRECPTCTLVNRKEANTCDACGSDLKHCPTYI